MEVDSAEVPQLLLPCCNADQIVEPQVDRLLASVGVEPVGWVEGHRQVKSSRPGWEEEVCCFVCCDTLLSAVLTAR